jgi:spermidine synthase
LALDIACHNRTITRPSVPPIAISLVSAGALGYEVLLIRLFSIVQWHHFAYMAISIAMLGYGASGSFLALFQDRLRHNFTAVFAFSAALFGVSAVIGFAIAQRLPFNALAVIWEPQQLLYLPAYYLLFAVPFFCAATCVGLAFAVFPDHIGRIYRYDMLGAGIGALGVVATLFWLFPLTALRLIGVLGLLAAAFASRDELGAKRWRRRAAYLVAAALIYAAIPSSWTTLRFSQYKELERALLIPGTEIVHEASSPLGLLTVIRNPLIPLRYAPGLSLNNAIEPPPQLGIFTDGGGLSPITSFDGRLEPVAYLDATSVALPYHLLERPHVLIIGAGGGADVLLALYHRAPQIDVVELNPLMAALVRQNFADFAGHLYDRPEVHVHLAEGRGFVAASDQRYDVIQLPLLDSFAAAGAGTVSLSENYIYTVEAFREYLRHLRPGGIVAITRWLNLPPRDSLKLFATALSALERMAVAEPEQRLALIRSWSTTTLLMKNGVLSPAEIGKIRAFADERSFDLAYYPGMSREDANRHNLLDQPYLFDGAIALLGPERTSFLARYKFDVSPATDDRPYFFDFFKWRALPELLERRALGGAALLDWGYLILMATLVQAGVLSLLLILAPLRLYRANLAPSGNRGRVAAYFLMIGLAFLFVEMASIQHFILFLSHPIYATAVVLCGFLVFAGLGSGFSPRLVAWAARDRAGATTNVRSRPYWRRFSALDLAIVGIVAIALLYLFLLPPLFRLLVAVPSPAKIAVALLLIAPLAFCMGMPFPLALSRVAASAPRLVPWAWGINGCASVLSAVLATLLAMNIGLTTVMLIAIALYLVAAVTFRAPLIDHPTGRKR